MKRIILLTILFFVTLVNSIQGAVEKIDYNDVEQLITAYNRWVEMRRYNYEASERYSLEGKIARIQCIYYGAMSNAEVTFVDATNQIAISLRLNTEKYVEFSETNRKIVENWIMKGIKPTRYVSFEITSLLNRELNGHLIRIHE